MCAIAKIGGCTQLIVGLHNGAQLEMVPAPILSCQRDDIAQNLKAQPKGSLISREKLLVAYVMVTLHLM